MNTTTIILLALLWIVACAAISLYILGKGMSAKQQFSLGLKAIFVSFLIGSGLLFVAITNGI
jgi:hypothetical protein